jgi:hypothetical protein
MREYPGELIEDHVRLSSIVQELVSRFKNRIVIHVIDPQSALGFYKSLRYWVREYPTFMIDGEQKITGWDQERLEQAIQTRLSTL